jgi:hypothetical protein
MDGDETSDNIQYVWRSAATFSTSWIPFVASEQSPEFAGHTDEMQTLTDEPSGSYHRNQLSIDAAREAALAGGDELQRLWMITWLLGPARRGSWPSGRGGRSYGTTLCTSGQNWERAQSSASRWI